jgi:hypothetical protein
MTHKFYSSQIVKLVALNKYEEFYSVFRGAKLTVAEECRKIVEFEARCLKDYCLPVLNGDYELLRQIS